MIGQSFLLRVFRSPRGLLAVLLGVARPPDPVVLWARTMSGAPQGGLDPSAKAPQPDTLGAGEGVSSAFGEGEEGDSGTGASPGASS